MDASRTMDEQELTQLLARAFDAAWSKYYRPARVTMSPELARPALASHLVEMAKDGLADEGQLSASGLLHLLSLTPHEPRDSSTCGPSLEAIDGRAPFQDH